MKHQKLPWYRKVFNSIVPATLANVLRSENHVLREIQKLRTELWEIKSTITAIPQNRTNSSNNNTGTNKQEPIPAFVMDAYYQQRFVEDGMRVIEENKKEYNEKAPRLKPDDARVVFFMDEKHNQSGLTDRLFAIIATFDLCQRLGVKFKIYHTFPFDFRDFFVPAKYDWKISQEELCRNPHDVIFLDTCKSRNENFSRSSHQKELSKFYRDFAVYSYQIAPALLEQLVKKFPDKQIQIFMTCGLRKETNDAFSKRFHELFKMNEPLGNAVENATKEWNERGGYIAMHYRFLSLLGSFEPGNSYPVLPEDEQQKLIQKCIQKTRELYEQNFKGKIILAVSDSKKFLDALSAECDFVRTLPGTPKHLATTTGSDYDANFKTFFDYMVIAGAEKVFGLTTGGMYKGNYARGAALINNVPFERIEF